MGWNYRVIRHSDEKTKSFWFHIHEVYYSDDGEIEGWTQNPKIPVGESAEDLKEFKATDFVESLLDI